MVENRMNIYIVLFLTYILYSRWVSILLCALVMAGGKGERFWPLSTAEKPKQFLNLLGEETMIQMTVNRLKRFIPQERIFIVTIKDFVGHVKEQLPFIKEENIIIEPFGRNTAPCIGLSALIINGIFPNSTLVIVPSDHLVVEEDKFSDSIQAACELTDSTSEIIVTLGITPTRPETGYGYIQYRDIPRGERSISGFKFKKVDYFKEKPDKKTAEKYLKQGNFLWNSGIFVWKTTFIVELLRRYLPNTYNILCKVVRENGAVKDDDLEECYKYVESISVDHGILEKTDNIYVLPVDFGWDDIGTWRSLERFKNKDKNNNICFGKIENYNSNNNIIISDRKPVVTVGVNDLLVVETDQIIFIGKKENIDNIKEIRKRFIDKKETLV